MGSRIRGEQPPERPYVRTYDVVYPKPGAPLDVTLLDGTPFGLYLHWVITEEYPKGRSRVCIRPGTCALCPPEGRAATWYAHLAAHNHTTGAKVIVTLAYDDFSLLCAYLGSGESLRGTRWVMMRSGRGKSGPVAFQRQTREPLRPLPARHNVLPTLERIYGVRLQYPDADGDRQGGGEGGGL